MKANLFQSTVIGVRNSSRLANTSNKSSSSGRRTTKVSCYPNGLQLNYTSVLSKPISLTSQLENLAHPLKDPGRSVEVGLSPRFYNVRKQFVLCGRDEEDEEEEEEEEEEEQREDQDSEMKMEAKIDDEVKIITSLFVYV